MKITSAAEWDRSFAEWRLRELHKHMHVTLTVTRPRCESPRLYIIRTAPKSGKLGFNEFRDTSAKMAVLRAYVHMRDCAAYGII